MPRNMVAPYEVRCTEVRGKDAVIKHLRLEDVKSAPFFASFSRLPDGHTTRITDSGHFAFASLGSYPATISHTTRVLRHVLTNDHYKPFNPSSQQDTKNGAVAKSLRYSPALLKRTYFLQNSFSIFKQLYSLIVRSKRHHFL